MSGNGVNKANEKSAKKTSQMDDPKQKTAFIAEVDGDELEQLEEEFEKISMQEVRQECQQTTHSGFKSPILKETPPAVEKDEVWSPWMLLNPSHAEETVWHNEFLSWLVDPPVAVPLYEICDEETDLFSFNMDENKHAQSPQKRKPSKTEKDGPKEERS